MGRIQPLVDVAPAWEHSEDYPDTIRVAMENGHVVTYRRDIVQPGPVLPVLGGKMVEGYKAKHTKKAGRGRWNPRTDRPGNNDTAIVAEQGGKVNG